MTGVWITMAVAGALTFLIRLSFLGLLGRREPPRWAARALGFVPPAVLSAIVFPEVFVRDGSFVPLSPRLAAAALAALVAWRSRSALLAIGAGMAALLLLQLLVP